MAVLVSSLSIIFMVITLIMCFAFPILLAIMFWKKYQGKWFALLIGALAFVVSQLFIRIPIISFLSTKEWYINFADNNFILFVIFLSLTAGLFEETARLIGFKILLKKDRLSDSNALMFGVGHGGIEAIVLVGLTYISNIIISIMINAGNTDIITANMTAQQATALVSQYVDTESYLFIFAGIERMATILFHIVLSILVYRSVRDKKLLGYFFAIGIHTLVNVVIVYFASINITISFALVILLFIVSLWFVLRFIKDIRKANLEEIPV